MAYIYDDSQTYTGEIVNFTSTDKANITSVSVPLTCSQDLHGYSNPWPAGGGKNKGRFASNITDGSRTQNGCTSSPVVGELSKVHITGTANGGTYYFTAPQTFEKEKADNKFLPAGTYTVSTNLPRTSGGVNAGMYITGHYTDGTSVSGNIAGYAYAEHPVTFTVSQDVYYNVQASVPAGYSFGDGMDIWVQIESGSSATAWTPYSNICPISGLTGLSVYVSPTQDPDDATTYAVDWTTEAGTVYGGTDEVVGGVLTDEWAEIPSYNGETITEPWLSSMDEYAPGATPTTGAQVVYKLATPLTYQLTPIQIAALTENYVWASNGASITVVVSDILRNFQGWLLKVGSGMALVPTEMIKAETYKVSPNQRMEETAERDSTGVLWRETVPNMPPKIEFNTPAAYDTDVNALNAIFRAAYSNEQERKLTVAFYDPEENVYKSWECYMPNIDFPIRTIDIDAKTILYDEIRYAFIGY